MARPDQDLLVWSRLQDMKINAGDENQRAADERLVGCPGKLGICSSRQPLQTLVRLELPERSLEIKWQDRYLPGRFPCAEQDARRNRLRAPNATMRALEVRYRKIREPASLPLRSGLPVRGRTSACSWPHRATRRRALARARAGCA